MRIIEFFWSRVTASAATAGMALVGLGEQIFEPGWVRKSIEENQLILLIGLATFLVLHSYRNWRREKTQTRGFLGNFESINNNVLHLISDLAELSSGQYHYWVVDLYVERGAVGFFRKRPFVFKKILEKKLSVALSGVSSMPFRITTEHNVFGVLVTRDEPLMWWDQRLTQTQLNRQNAEVELDESANANLKEQFGVVKVWPITDELRRRPRGILVIHTKRDAVASTAALGVLAGEQGDRLCLRAAQNIHGELG